MFNLETLQNPGSWKGGRIKILKDERDRRAQVHEGERRDDRKRGLPGKLGKAWFYRVEDVRRGITNSDNISKRS